MFYNPFFTDDDERYDIIDELDYTDSLSIRDLQTSDTLVIHPSDTTTDFLKAIYKAKGWDVTNDPFVDPDIIEELIETHERIVCLGHGSPAGLFGGMDFLIHGNLVQLLKQKEMVAIWCNADRFMLSHGLAGFYSGMFLSEPGECDLFGVPCENEQQIGLSNDLFASVLGRHIDSGDNILENEKLIKYLFLNIVYLLRKNNEVLLYEAPQYGDPDLGFAVTMFRVDHKTYDIAAECFRLLGKEPSRECGVTMSVAFDTHEENIKFKDHFKSLMKQAQDRFKLLGGKSPDEYYFMKMNPVFKGTEDTPNDHLVYLQANIEDDLDRVICEDVVGDCEIKGRGNDQPVNIKVRCYRKKWQKSLVRYLENLGIGEIY